jgi:putative transposase
MLIGGYKIRNQAAAHFLTFTVVGWIDVFTRQLYRDILLDNIRYCQQNRGLLLHAWCLMSNHIHLVATAGKKDLSDVIRDFKKESARQLLRSISGNRSESRRDWMLSLFADFGQSNSRNAHYQFWKHDNHPEELFTGPFIFQKIDYTHQNPVAAGIVDNAEDYLYSSARDYHTGKKCGLLEIDFLV